MDYREQQEPESFVVIEDGSVPLSLAAIDSIGDDLSLEEAVSRVRDLTRQNAELRNTVDTNSKQMHTQIQFLTEWKAGWENYKTEVKEKNDQARQVVNDLRGDVAKKDAKIEQLTTRISEKSTPVTVEEQEWSALRQKIELLSNQVIGLSEEKNRITSAKDDVCRELDQHTKIVADLQVEKQALQEENKALLQGNDKLTQEVKVWMEKGEKLIAEKQELNEQNEKLMSYTLVEQVGQTVSDAAVSPTSKAGQSQFQSETMLNMDKNMTDLMSQLQGLRGENSELKQAIQTKNQEMEALHRKVHDEAERLVNAEHNHRQTVNKLEIEYKHSVEQLNNELSRLKSQQSPRGSIDGSTQSMEEVKSLKTQVVSLGNELDSANERLKGIEALYQKQKERMEVMGAKLHSQHDDMEHDRGKADELINKLQQSVSSLEGALEAEKQDNILKTSALAENRKKFAQLLHDYHESIAHREECKQQLEHMKSGGRYYQQMQNQVDNLTAQLLAADESLGHKNEELMKLQREKDQAVSDVDKVSQILPVLKAQCDIFKNDFEAERSAREKMHQGKEQLRDDNEQLHIENTRLKDEVQRLSDTQIQMLRDRHAYAHGTPGGAATLPRMSTALHAAAPRANAPDEDIRCPKCNGAFPDIDTLQLHVFECIT